MADPTSVKELIDANLGGGGEGGITRFDLQRIRVPAGGGLTWDLSDFGVEDSAEVTGVIVGRRSTRIYYAQSFEETGGGQPPDCSSSDGTWGVGSPGGDCTKCPLAQFGSAQRGAGQACRAQQLMLIILPQQLIPALLVVPPTSLQNMRRYGMQLVGMRAKMNQVITSFRLERLRSKSGIAYSAIKPHAVQPITDPEHARAFDAIAAMWAPIFDAIKAEEVEAS
jgi:hypothetical protein